MLAFAAIFVTSSLRAYTLQELIDLRDFVLLEISEQQTLKAAAYDTKTTILEEQDDIGGEILSKEAQKSTLNSEIDDLSTSIANLYSTLVALDATLDPLEAEISDYASQANSLAGEVSYCQGLVYDALYAAENPPNPEDAYEVAELWATYYALADLLDYLQGEYDQAYSWLQDASDEYYGNLDQMENILYLIESYGDQIDAKEAAIATIDSQLITLNDDYAYTEDLYDNVMAFIAACNATLASLNADLDMLNYQIEHY